MQIEFLQIIWDHGGVRRSNGQMLPAHDGPVLMNAAGTVKTLAGVRDLLRTPVPAVVVGSFTMAERHGNEGRTYFASAQGTLNSMGLPSPALETWRTWLPEMSTMLHAADKELWVSVAGFSPKEYRHLTEEALLAGADAVELNLGCPNVWDAQGQKPIVSYSVEQTALVLEEVGDLLVDATVGVKLSPLLDPQLLLALDRLIAGSPLTYVAAINTVPNCFAFGETGVGAISVESGLAGMSGPATRWIGLGQVKAHRQILTEMPILGVGGVTTGSDVRAYLSSEVGATGCQVATAFLRGGPRVFSELLLDYAEVEHSAAA